MAKPFRWVLVMALAVAASAVSDAAGQELEALRSYRRAAAGPQEERAEMAVRWTLLNVQRKAAWARFRELARMGD